MKLQTHDLSYFLIKIFFGDDGSQSIFVYQPRIDTLDLKKGKGINYVLSWKSKGVFSSRLIPLYIAFLHNIHFPDIKWE